MEVRVVLTKKFSVLDVVAGDSGKLYAKEKVVLQKCGQQGDEQGKEKVTNPTAVATATAKDPALGEGGGKEKEGEQQLRNIPRTNKLYYNDTYLYTCRSRILAVLPPQEGGETQLTGGAVMKLALDQTIFHVQGGGQPSDVGIIKSVDGLTSWRVVLKEENGVVLHHIDLCAGAQQTENNTNSKTSLPPLPVVGEEVDLFVDKDVRLLHAKLHSAGHCMDVAVRRAGYESLKPTKGYHFPDNPNVEYVGVVEDKEEFVTKVNEEIIKCIAEEIATTSTVEPSGGGALLRVVNVSGGDCPCAGTHVANTSELKGLRVTKAKAKKGTIKVSYVFDG